MKKFAILFCTTLCFPGHVFGAKALFPARRLYFAAQEGNLSHVRELLKKNPELTKEQVSFFPRGIRKETALHAAAGAGHVAIIKELIAHGAAVNAKTHYAVTPLHIAKDAASAEELLRAGADADAISDAGVTPMHTAVRKRDAKFVEALLKHRADPNRQFSFSGRRQQLKLGPLHFAAYQGEPGIVKVLLDYGANSALPDSAGKKPIEYARQGSSVGHTQVYEMLSDYEPAVQP